MFGSKKEKAERMARYQELLDEQALSPAQLAEKLGVPRSTVMRDLPLLEDQGVLLQEEGDGKVRLFRKWW
jgi:DNA-binding IclR family transcriptional regulator